MRHINNENSMMLYNFYTQAIELDKENMLLYSNRSAVYFEMGKYDESIKEGEQSIEVGTNHTASYKKHCKSTS